ncbi:MAG TPA: adenylosuccinate synthase [Bacteroidetes bacterium]|nr:adenylosuccinate synthase [Bacteroidota bacterium]
MSVRVIVGAQWGDEGKGKIVDLLGTESDVVARFQGGANAGHTVVVNDAQFILHLIPSGILHPDVTCYIGNGVVIDPAEVLREIDFLEKKGVHVRNRLFISGYAHVILPYHQILDKKKERDPNLFLGTTGRGIGPAYVDKVDRIGIRMIDLLNEDVLREKISLNLQLKADQLAGQEINRDVMVAEYLQFGEQLRANVADISVLLNKDIKAGKNVLLEGAQGTLLDVDFGTYPFVTSSNPSVGSACSGLGIGPTNIDSVIGVFKAYTTRVGEGPFPTEFDEEFAKRVRSWGNEFGATTGRPRRCGWFDAVLARYSARINGLTGLAITKLDVLDQFGTIRICTGYQIEGEFVENLLTDRQTISRVEPVYEEMPGWQQPTSDIREFEKLSREAQNYVKKIEELIEVPVTLISVGSERKQTIICE